MFKAVVLLTWYLTKGLFQLFNTFSVNDPNIICDHSVVSFSLRSSFKQSKNCTTDVGNNTKHIPYMYKLDNNKKDIYINDLF